MEILNVKSQNHWDKLLLQASHLQEILIQAQNEQPSSISTLSQKKKREASSFYTTSQAGFVFLKGDGIIYTQIVVYLEI